MNRAVLSFACAFLCGIGATAAQAQSYNPSPQIANAPQGVTRNYRQSTPQSYSPSTTTSSANNGFDMSSFSAPAGTNLYPNANSYTPTSTEPLNTVDQAAVRAQISPYNPVDVPALVGDPLSGVARAIQRIEDHTFFLGASNRVKM